MPNMHSTRRFHAKGAFRRLRRYFETRSLRYCAGLFAVLLGLVALAAPSPYCIETPGPTQDVLGELSGRSSGEVIAVEGADTYTDEGELLLTTVNASGVPGYPVSNIVALIGWFDPDTVVMPNEAVVPIGQTAEEYAGESQQEMDQSQHEAVDAALAFLQDRGVDVSGVDVDMHVEGIGGPSAGMMYALGLIDKLTPESETGGQTIAGTGTIDAEGNVGAIGGVRLKMLGAKR
ncbi:MAG: Lon protease, partial [Bifidobacterium sp.]|nr:Lon protease [Bifidobacterium sp.]